jgi:hypothetical protein
MNPNQKSLPAEVIWAFKFGCGKSKSKVLAKRKRCRKYRFIVHFLKLVN